jgi:hypothetical protein
MTKFSALVTFEGSCTLIPPAHRQYFATEDTAIEINAADMPPAEFDHQDEPAAPGADADQLSLVRQRNTLMAKFSHFPMHSHHTHHWKDCEKCDNAHDSSSTCQARDQEADNVTSPSLFVKSHRKTNGRRDPDEQHHLHRPTH